MSISPDRAARRSPLAMAILLLLTHEPMHPYGLRQRVQEWDKDRVINVAQRNAVYQTVDRLRRSGLVRLKELSRHENRPERAIYEATPEGAETALAWLADMLATPVMEYPSFPAALAFVQSLPHPEVVKALEDRQHALQKNIDAWHADVDARVKQFPGGVDRIFLAEVEYQLAMWEAEKRWLAGFLDDLRTSSAWTEKAGDPGGQAHMV
ncbi:MAG: PadR family transcriptional regulator [Actinoplanes sp.]